MILPQLKYDPSENIMLVLQKYKKIFKIKATDKYILSLLDEDRHTPSLLTICDILSKLGFVNNAYECTLEQLEKQKKPIICQIVNNEVAYFTVIKGIKNSTITYLDPVNGCWVKSALLKFASIYTKNVLISRTQSEFKEENYSHNLTIKITKQISKVLISLIIVILSIKNLITQTYINGIYDVLNLILLFSGFCLSFLLIANDIGQQINSNKNYCTGTGRQCNNVLNSKGANILGVKWSHIGLIYFLGCFLSRLMVVEQIVNLNILLYVFSAVGLIFIPYSIIYQKLIIKGWCKLCLSVQIVLFASFLCNYKLATSRGLESIFQLNGHNILVILLSFTVPSLFVSYYLPIVIENNKNKMQIVNLNKFKFNPYLFETLLQMQPRTQDLKNDIGIDYGDTIAKNKIIKICHPYCAPCAESQKVLGKILKSNFSINIKMIFLISSPIDDAGIWPARHMVALSKKMSNTQMEEVIQEWYSLEGNKYEIFKNKYPVELDELIMQDEELYDMNNWCNNNNIRKTPTIILNNRHLPPIYNDADLIYILNN